MLKDFFSYPRLVALTLFLVSLVIAGFLMITRSMSQNYNRQVAQATVNAADTQVPTPTRRPTNLPTIAPVMSPAPTQIDWTSLGVAECNEPFIEFYQSQGLEFPIGAGVWVSDAPCMGLWEVPFYKDGVLVAEDLVFTAVLNNQWVMVRQPDDYQIIRTDDTIIHLENFIKDDQAFWNIFNIRTLEKITITLSQHGDINITPTPIAIQDITSTLGPDNDCNWPHLTTYVGEFLTIFPNSDYIWTSDTWAALDGCQVGYGFLVANSDMLLLVSQGGLVRTTPISGLTHNWLVAADKSGNLFYTSGAEFVQISNENKAIITSGNLELFSQLSDLTMGIADTSVAYDLYQRSVKVIPAEATQMSPRAYQRSQNGEEETANIYSFTYQVDGVWHSAIFVMDFATGFYGPVDISNIREFSSWAYIDATHLAGYYADGSYLTFTLNSDGSLTAR